MKVLVSVVVSVLGSVIREEKQKTNWQICQTQNGQNGVLQSEHPFKTQFLKYQ